MENRLQRKTANSGIVQTSVLCSAFPRSEPERLKVEARNCRKSNCTKSMEHRTISFFMLDAAMRYALGRKSYDVGLVAGFIKDNLSVFNEKWLVNNKRHTVVSR